MIKKTAIALALMVGPATAHDAPPTKSQPLGWQYGKECCSLYDCQPMQAGAIKETQSGYVVVNTGEVIPMTDPRVKTSKDELFHRCAPMGDMTNKWSICLYVPDRGY